MASRKKKGGKKGDDWDDDDDVKLKQLAVASKPADDDGDGGNDDEPDSDDDDEPIVKPSKGKAGRGVAAFNLLAQLEDGGNSSDGESSDREDQSDDDAPSKKVPEQRKISDAQSVPPASTTTADVARPPTTATKKGKQKGKKGGKKGADDEEDLDAILAELDGPQKSDNKTTQERTAAAAEPAEHDDNEEGATADVELTDAQRKKREKRLRKKGKEKAAGDAPADEMAAHDKDGVPKEASEEPAVGEGGEAGDEEEGEGEGKKKKKKKVATVKEEKKDSKRKKHVDAIKEMLRVRQEAEEEMIKKAKEEEERLEAFRAQKDEEERLAKEKREREKQKKKDKDARLKAEGKYMTPAQKEKMKRAQAMLANMSDAYVPALHGGDDLPKKKPVYGKKKPQKVQQNAAGAVTEKRESSVASEEASSIDKSEKTAESWEDQAAAGEEEEEVLDDWEQVDIVAEEKELPTEEVAKAPTKAAPDVKPAATVAKQPSAERSSEQAGSSSEDESGTSEEETSSDEEEDDKTGKETKEQIRERVMQRLKKRREDAVAKRSTDKLRAPIICVLGHVDTGKTKMLDTIRRTHVQDDEAGGITQQIGATQVPVAAISERCKHVKDFDAASMKLPGFLIIDTPGHESFANLRSRGSSLCDIAILVVDIMHGLEPQTIESLKLLLKRKTPFVIALNKIDRLYGWESSPRKDIRDLLKSQDNKAQLEFKERLDKVSVEFAEQGLNVALYWEDRYIRDPVEYVPIVPTSAMLGDGIGNVMAHIAQRSQTQLADKLAFFDDLECTVMEVKAIDGLGTTIDVILVNGSLRVGDAMVLTGTNGPIVTSIRELLMPQPLKELRVKNQYEHFQAIKGAQGVKVLAKNLDRALAGLPLFVANREDEVDVLREEVKELLEKALHSIKLKSEGVYVQASTLGSLEALLEFLKSQKIPYCGVNIGPVHKKDVTKASAMLERKSEFAVILAFDVPVERDAQLEANKSGVRIFTANIIYHLEDAFLKYREELKQAKRKAHEAMAIFPCKLRILPQHIYNARNPIVVGVSIEAGQLKRGTPICVPSKENMFIGTVESIEKNEAEVKVAKQGDEVCIKIANTTGDAPKLYGRHFSFEDTLVSRISRETIDVCKTYFRDDLTKADWLLVVQLKKLLGVF